jgi:hypothetical protein
LSVCLSQVKGQENINDQTNAFSTQLSSIKVSRGWVFSQSGFEGPVIQQINIRGAGNSTNQVLRGWKFSQSGNFTIRVASNQVIWEPED